VTKFGAKDRLLLNHAINFTNFLEITEMHFTNSAINSKRTNWFQVSNFCSSEWTSMSFTRKTEIT